MTDLIALLRRATRDLDELGCDLLGFARGRDMVALAQAWAEATT